MKYALVAFVLFCTTLNQQILAQKLLTKNNPVANNEFFNDSTLQISKEITVVKNAKPVFTTNSIITDSKAAVAPTAKPSEMSALAMVTDAGRTQTTLDISGAGGANFSVPISLPVGLGNAVPLLSLFYNSQSGNGIAGYGWNISGLSAITRVGSTTVHDQRISGVNFDQYDRFSFDGQRLMLKSGTYGGNGAEYQTENYTNIRIISKGVSPYGASYGPEHFEVLYPDGSKAYFGQNANSRTPTDYSITYSENAIGARINYEYTASNNTLLPSKISYGSIGTASSINEIKFNYTNVNRQEQAYAAGASFLRTSKLMSIAVVGNGVAYRNYALSYGTMAALNYDRLTSIQESDGASTRSLEPINFTYGNTGDIITTSTLSNLSLSGIASNNSEIVTADFTGNGSMDFLLYPKYNKNKFWTFYDLEPGSSFLQWGREVTTGEFYRLFTATWLTDENKAFSGQGILLVKNPTWDTYKFEMLSSGSVSPVYFQYDRTWTSPRAPDYYSECDQQIHPGGIKSMDFISGDFNGDGLTELIAINYGEVIVHESLVDIYGDGYPYCLLQYADQGSSAYFINMDRRITSNFVTNLGPLTSTLLNGDKLLTGDVNGDGKTDIIHVKEGVMYVYTMSHNNTLQLLWQTSDSRIKLNELILPGDYNGDGKLDLMFSTGYNSLFVLFMSTGKGFIKHEKNQPFSHTENKWNGSSSSQTLDLYTLIPTDINGDGKTDIVRAQSSTRNNNSYGTASIAIYHNSNSANSQPVFNAGATQSLYTTLKHYPIPIFLNPNRPNQLRELGFVSENNITLFKSQKDLKSEMQITEVSHGGVNHMIEYRSLTTDQTGVDIPLYESDYDQVYPYINLESTPAFTVVSKLTRFMGNSVVKQIFGYGKAVTHAQGLGFLGFREVIRSNWHTDSSDPNRTFNISISDPLLRGATIKSFESKSNYIAPSIKNISLTNPAPSTAIADGASLSDYISRTDQLYSTTTLPNKVFLNVPTTTATKDQLNNTFGSQTLTYDAYYNNTKSVQKFGTDGTKTVDATYINSTTTPYFIGRPSMNKTTLTAGPETFTSQEDYTYTGALLTKLRNKGHETPYMTEDMTHDAYGNIIKKIITGTDGTQRTLLMEYDATGRFLTKTTDAEGMATSFTYNSSNGNLTSTTNPFLQTENYLYDTWSRRTRTTDFLNVKANVVYEKIGFNTKITKTDDEGSQSSTLFNAVGQIIQSQEKAVNGQFFGQLYLYDVYGRQNQVSEVSQPGSYNQWNTVEYDNYGREKKQTQFTGKVINTTYSGLSKTVNDGTKSVTTTQNGMGQVVSILDPGGTITNSYFGNGNLKSTSFAGSSQVIEQDGWGRRTKLIDPSAGQYTYTYDGFGEIKKETTPKGSTEYFYSPTGKVTSKAIVGDNTNMQFTYAYNSTTKLLSTLTLVNSDGNNSTYNYIYDSEKRVSKVAEENQYVKFEKEYTYDSFGKIATESYLATNKLTGQGSTKRTVEMTYQNGDLLQTTLQNTGEVLWKANTIDMRGKLASSLQGSTLKTTYAYDTYGYPQSYKFEKINNPTAVLTTLAYNYNPTRGTLSNRSNSAFNWNENFSYDIIDRLTDFNDNNGNNSQTYDSQGRIVNNSQIGTYVYSGNSYRQTELNLSSASNTYYQSRALLKVNYNAFKSPVEIYEPGKDRISFEYNSSLSRATMFYGGEQEDKILRRYRRHYSEDGSMEMTFDKELNKTTFSIYLGGDAYTAPAIWKVALAPNTPTQTSLFYLHRDVLGSIVMISSPDGNAVEKRIFDAWGNLVKLTDGTGNALTEFIVTDRGFTGHEHLLSVGLIHMNGRLYDPKIHRFLSPDNFVQDPSNTQNFNRYGYAMNNPLSFNDPTGEFLHIIIGAAIGGVFNLGIKALQGKIHSFKDGAAAFGIGAVAGGLGAATGGASLAASGLAGASVTGGALAGFTGAVVASPIQGLGNMAYFGDKYSVKQWGKDALFGAVAGGVIGGATAYFKGNNIWKGDPIGNGRNAFSFNNSDKFTIKAEGLTGVFEGSGNIYKNGEYAGNTNNEVRAIVKPEPYPPDDGFLGGYSETTTIRPGTVINRYGGEYGKYFSNTSGTPENLALPPANDGALIQYRVIKSFPVRGGIAAPYYGKPGLGVQFLSPKSIEWLRINKYIKKL